MRRLLKIIDNLARLIAVIDIGKQISEHLASKKDTNNTKKKRNRLISQRLRFVMSRYRKSGQRTAFSL